jgi:hypothetical protein
MRPSLLVLAENARRLSGFWTTGALVAVLAGAAWAGPTSTTGGPTTTTTTTTGGSTTTGPATTTTTTTTTTAAPTTTTTAAPTTTTTTTTTTTFPTNLSGQYPFTDKKIGSQNLSFQNIDTASGQICVSGLVEAMDTTVTLNRRVTITYTSVGVITKQSDKKVDGQYETVDLNLNITAPRSPTNGGPIVFYNQTITVGCKLRTSFRQPRGLDGLAAQEPALDRVNLDCNVGPDFQAFSDVNPLDPSLLDNIEFAFADRHGLRADVRTGRIKITTNGTRALPDDDDVIPLTCDLPD